MSKDTILAAVNAMPDEIELYVLFRAPQLHDESRRGIRQSEQGKTVSYEVKEFFRVRQNQF